MQRYLSYESLVVDSPSRRDGIPIEHEKETRLSGIRMIHRLGESLGFPYHTMATATVYFHYFFTFYTMKKYSYLDVAITCILVASKVEETYRKIKQILIAACTILNPDFQGFDIDNEEFESHRMKVACYERLLLDAIAFNFHCRHPHRFGLKFLKRILGDERARELKELCFRILGQFYDSTLCLQYPIGHLALASALFSALQADLAGNSREEAEGAADASFALRDIEKAYLSPPREAQGRWRPDLDRRRVSLAQLQVKVMLYSSIKEMPPGLVSENDAVMCQLQTNYQAQGIGTLLMRNEIGIASALAFLDATATIFNKTGKCNLLESSFNSTFGFMRSKKEIFEYTVDRLVMLENRALLCGMSSQPESCSQVKEEIYNYESFLMVLIYGRIFIGDEPQLSKYAADREQYLTRISEVRKKYMGSEDCVLSKQLKPKSVGLVKASESSKPANTLVPQVPESLNNSGLVERESPLNTVRIATCSDLLVSSTSNKLTMPTKEAPTDTSCDLLATGGLGCLKKKLIAKMLPILAGPLASV